MKLKHYLSAKKLKRKLSKFNVTETHCNDNGSFTDYNDNERKPKETVSKDDMFLRPKKEGRSTIRADMAKSFTGVLPFNTVNIDIDKQLKTVDHGSQTDINYEIPYHASNSSIASSVTLCTYKDNINNVELCSQPPLEFQWENSMKKACTCSSNGQVVTNCGCNACRSCTCWQYQSLPSSQTQYNHSIHYNSLPSSFSSATHATSEASHAPHECSNRWRRSRIKTNPWLPLPSENTEETLRRKRRVDKRAEPRLSRFFSEVEELMREQLTLNTDKTFTASICNMSQSNESIASTCSTATEVAVKRSYNGEDTYTTLGSPSEGYKSACCSISSDLNLADTESLTDSRASSNTDLSKYSESLNTSRHNMIVHSQCPPSLQDFQARSECNWPSMNSLLSESMFSSLARSSKCEALEDKVRKLCQSTSDLDEKMRLARLECSYIQNS